MSRRQQDRSTRACPGKTDLPNREMDRADWTDRRMTHGNRRPEGPARAEHCRPAEEIEGSDCKAGPKPVIRRPDKDDLHTAERHRSHKAGTPEADRTNGQGRTGHTVSSRVGTATPTRGTTRRRISERQGAQPASIRLNRWRRDADRGRRPEQGTPCGLPGQDRTDEPRHPRAPNGRKGDGFHGKAPTG